MRTIGRLILSAVFLLLTGVCVAVATYAPEFFFGFYTDFSRQALGFLAKLTAPFPFAVWEVLLLLIVLLVLYTLVRDLTQKRGFLCWLAGVALLLCIGLFLFVGLWGLNHFGPSIAERTGLSVRPYTQEELTATTQYMADQASCWADQVPRDAQGHMVLDFSAAAKKAPSGYEALAPQNPFFASPTHAPVKRLLVDKAFSYAGLTGIFVAFTGESGVNPDTYVTSIPFTMCHELAHRLTVAPEDEANFCAFLSCKEVDDPAFQYSAWYSAFIYTYNALWRVNKDQAKAIMAGAAPNLQLDCDRANDHYDQYEGKVQEAAEKVNDTYLKAFNEPSGVQSYGEVADLLIAWYLSN